MVCWSLTIPDRIKYFLRISQYKFSVSLLSEKRKYIYVTNYSVQSDKLFLEYPNTNCRSQTHSLLSGQSTYLYVKNYSVESDKVFQIVWHKTSQPHTLPPPTQKKKIPPTTTIKKEKKRPRHYFKWINKSFDQILIPRDIWVRWLVEVKCNNLIF